MWVWTRPTPARSAGIVVVEEEGSAMIRSDALDSLGHVIVGADTQVSSNANSLQNSRNIGGRVY
jgi:hypothetical protein